MSPLAERFASPVTGPAYRRPARVVAVATVLALVVWGVKISDQLAELNWAMWVMLIAAFGGVVVTTWYIVTGQTTVDARGIRQQWLVEKSYRWDEIARARHVRLPFSSRLMITTGFGPSRAIQSGSAELDEAFREIAAHYRAAALMLPR